jgi:TRAP transporter TAXI family solute receptor
MKKFLILSMVLILVAALAACTPAAPTPAPGGDANGNGEVNGEVNGNGNGDDGPPLAPAARLNFATGGVAGTYYPLGGAMAVVINDRTNLNITVMSSGASADNIRQLDAGDAHIAIAQNDVMSYAFNGTEIWADSPPVTNIATLMSLYPETIQIIVLADSDIYSVEDLRGQRVSIGDIGSGVEANAVQVLGAYGLTVDDITREALGFGGSADLMRDGGLDAFFVTAATPNTAVLELSTARDLRIINLSEEAINQLLADYAYYVRVSVSAADGYAFMTEPINTVAVQATLVASTDLDDQVAYDIVRALIDGQGDIGHARGAYIGLESAVQSISVDFHPGARRFFEDRGVLD